MADNPAYAADDISSVIYPRVKQTLGPDGTATADWAGRQLSSAVGGAAFVDVRNACFRVSQTPTVSSGSAYTAGDAVGGLLTFTSVARTSGFPVVLTNVAIVDLGKQSAAMDLVLFDRTFSATSDNAAFDAGDSDLANVLDVIEFATTDWHGFNDNSVAVWPETAGQSGRVYTLNGTSLFGQLVTRGTPTYTSTSDIIVIVSGYQL